MSAQNCPSCSAEVLPEASSCSDCNYSYSLLREYYKDYPAPASTSILTDLSDTLSISERAELISDLAKFQILFPGLYFAVYLESAGEAADTKGLWLHNNLQFTDTAPTTANQYGLLLYIDPVKEVASLSYGLGLAPYITLQESNSFIESSLSQFLNKKYLEGIKQVVKATTNHLITKCPD